MNNRFPVCSVKLDILTTYDIPIEISDYPSVFEKEKEVEFLIESSYVSICCQYPSGYSLRGA